MSTVDTEMKNGSKAVVMGCACVIFSSLTPDEIKRFKAFHPEALQMKDEDDGTVFSIDIENGAGSLLPEGATFSNVTSADGKATITVLLDPDIEDPMDAVKDRLGKPLMNLIEMEEHLLKMLPDLKEEEQKIEAQFMRL